MIIAVKILHIITTTRQLSFVSILAISTAAIFFFPVPSWTYLRPLCTYCRHRSCNSEFLLLKGPFPLSGANSFCLINPTTKSVVLDKPIVSQLVKILPILYKAYASSACVQQPDNWVPPSYKNSLHKHPLYFL